MSYRLMGIFLLLIPSATAFVIPPVQVVTNAVPSRIPEKLIAALASHFSAPHFSALASHCRKKKSDRQKDEGQKERRYP